MFDPEGNVFVPVTRTVKRKRRKDGSLVLPTSCFSDYWVPSYDATRKPWPVDGEKGADGVKLTEEQLAEKYGREWEWKDVEDAIVVRPPLVEYYKDRTSVESVLFIHRCAHYHLPAAAVCPRARAHCAPQLTPPPPPPPPPRPPPPAVARPATCATCT